MNRRWLIRNSLITLASLLTAAWLISLSQSIALEYFDGASESYIAITSGTLQFGKIEPGKNSIPQPLQGSSIASHQFQLIYHPTDPLNARSSYLAAPHHAAGFALDWFESSPTRLKAFAPLSLLATLSAALLLLAWRKTRPRPTPTAFPIEPLHPKNIIPSQ